jgi:hypothetical protein
MQNFDADDEVPLRNFPSQKSESELHSGQHSDRNSKMSPRPPDENGSAKRRSAKKSISRKRSHNIMEISGLSLKKRANTFDIKLPKETIKRIDYVIVYENKSIDEITGKKEREKHEKKLKLREKFLKSLKYDDVDVQQEVIGEFVFMKLHVAFRRLCKEADRIKLEMPLQDVCKQVIKSNLLRKMINNSNICGLFIICQYSFFEGDRK